MIEGKEKNDISNDIAMLLYMPIYYNGLVVESTNRCNARCAMCYQGSGPMGSDTRGPAKLDVQIIQRCIREAAEIDTIAPRFHLAGGEAFLYPEDCYPLFKEARDAGFEIISATTNGFWGKTMESAREVCKRLRDSGLNSLELSWDFWHQSFVPGASVSNCLQACKEYQIDSNLRILTTQLHNMEEALSALHPEVIDLASRITCGPVFATGRAAKELDPEEFFCSHAALDDSCHRTLNFSVNAFGDVHPCCAGFDQTNNYVIGNVMKDSIGTIAERMNRDPLIRKLVFAGIGSLVPILSDNGIDIGKDYFNICHLCYTIFSTPEYADCIRKSLNERKRNALSRVILQFENSLGSREG